MNLRTKLLISIISGMAVVILGCEVVQQVRTRTLVNRLAADNLTKTEGIEWENVGSLQQTSESALLDAMSNGEMDRFSKLLRAQKRVRGVQELSLYARDGRVAFSTDRALLKQTLPPDLKDALLTSTAPQRRRTAGSLIIFRPVAVVPGCIECHPHFKGRKIGGVLGFRYSARLLDQAQARWTTFGTELNGTTLRSTIFTTLLLIAIVGLVVALQVHYQVAKPLHRISRRLREGAGVLNAAADSILESSQALAKGACEQAAASEETSSSLEQTCGMTRRNAEHAAEAERLAAEAHAATEAGTRSMVSLQEAMRGIEASSNGVAKVLKNIDEIAFQTNILALNAAVEAARGGEAGMGFAVVADEVRSLAKRCADAARSTEELAEASVIQARRGSAVSTEVGTHLEEIKGKARRESEYMQQIARASQEQLSGIDQIAQAVRQIDRITQANAAGGEQAAVAARRMRSQAAALEAQVNDLTALVDGRAARPPGARGPRRATRTPLRGAGGDTVPQAGRMVPATASTR